MKFIKITLNEIKQQSRRLAVWVALILLIIYFLSTLNVKTPYDSGWDYELLLFENMTLGNGHIWFLIAAVLCSDRIIKDKRTKCYDILFATPITKSQYYFGKFIGDIIFFSFLAFITTVFSIIYVEFNFEIPFINGNVINFLFFFFINTITRITIGVTFAFALTLLFRNSIVSAIISAVYFNLAILLGPLNPIVLYIGIYPSHYSTFTQFVLVPSEYATYHPLSKTYELSHLDHFTLQKAYIGIALTTAMTLILCLTGFLIFRKNEYKPGGFILSQKIKVLTGRDKA